MIHVANALCLPGSDVNHPAWDTMMVLRNTYTSPVNCRIKLYQDADGSLVQWPHFNDACFDDHCDVIVQPNRMWAASFIPGNGFLAAEGASVAAPQNWQGHAEIECTVGAFNADSSILAFFLLANNAWKYGTNGVYRKDYSNPALTAKKLWQFAYSIPNFNDLAGATASQWYTGCAVANKQNTAVPCHLTYTIGQTYGHGLEGLQYSIDFTVPASGVARFDMLRGNPSTGIHGLLDSGYPPALNSEGHVDITSPSAALLQPSIMVVNSLYSFTVTEDECY